MSKTSQETINTMVWKACDTFRGKMNMFLHDINDAVIEWGAENASDDKHIQNILGTYKKRRSIEKYSHKATLKEIQENDYNLNIPRFVDTFEEEEIVDNDGELELNVSLEQETVWLNRNQISLLLGRDVKTIGKHINNVFKDGELDKSLTIANFATVQNEGGREVKRDVEYYNLDVIISVGYRVKSQRGVKFRQWATSILKSYIQDGYAINTYKIAEQRLLSLENAIYHIGASLKDLGKKWFAFSKMDKNSVSIMEKLVWIV